MTGSPLPAEEGGRPTRDEVSALAAVIEAAQGECARSGGRRWGYFIPGGWAGDRLASLLNKLQRPASVVSSEEGGRATDCSSCGHPEAGHMANGGACIRAKDGVPCPCVAYSPASVVGDASEGAARKPFVPTLTVGEFQKRLGAYDATVAERHAEEAGGWEKINERNERNALYLADLTAPDEDDIDSIRIAAEFGAIWLRDALASLHSTRAALEEARGDAENWRALMSIARFRMLGCAGLDNPVPGDAYAHIGLELWTQSLHAGNDALDRDYFARFVEVAKLARAIPSQESTKV